MAPVGADASSAAPPAWEQLLEAASALVLRLGPALERSGRRTLPRADSRPMAEHPPAAQARARTGDEGLPPRLTLWRDTHAWCTHCRMVWMALEEKKLPHRVELVNLRSYGRKRKDFLAPDLSPGGTVPVLQVGGEVLLGSADVTVDEMLMALEEPPGEHQASLASPVRLLPEGSPGLPRRAALERAWSLLRLRRELWARDQDWLRECVPGKGKAGGGKGKGRGKPGEDWSADEDAKEASTRARFFQGLEWAEGELEKGSAEHGCGPWFFGPRFSLLDIAFSPVIERAFATAFYYKGLVLWDHPWPRINAWLGALAERSSYRAVASDLHTHAHIHSGHLGRWGPCARMQTEAAASARRLVDSLQLFSEDGCLLPPPERRALPFLCWPRRPPRHDALEAAYALARHRGPVLHAACAQAGVLRADAEPAYRAAAAALLEFAADGLQEESSLRAHLDEAIHKLGGDGGRLCPVAGQPVAAFYTRSGQWYRAAVVRALAPAENAELAACGMEDDEPRFKISWSSADESEDSPGSLDAYYGEVEQPLRNLRSHLCLAARALRFTADRVCVPRDVGPGGARLLRGALCYCAERLDPGGEVAGRVEIPVLDRYDQDPERFYGPDDRMA